MTTENSAMGMPGGMMGMMLLSKLMGGDSGSNDPESTKMLMQLLMGGGDSETIVESVFTGGAVFGTTLDRSGEMVVGTFEVSVVPPHVKDPTARIRVKTNGTIFCKPDQLVQMVNRLTELISQPELLQAYIDAQDDEEAVAAEAKAAASQKGLMAALT